jgi:RsiW-degrading membrane proteinase PrsW (M82 family)
MKTALKQLGKLILALAVALVGIVLLVSLPLGAFRLLSFLFRELDMLLFIPGFLVYVLFFCGPVGLVQWSRKSRGVQSCALRLASAGWLAVGAAVAIVVGQWLLISKTYVLFWPAFVLAAALPPLAALALANQRLGSITTWRHALAGVLSGSLISTHLTILLGAGVSLLGYLLVLPLRELVAHVVASPSLERLFFSPMLAVALVELAIVAPLVEELAKPVAAIFLAPRLRGPAEAFLVGMAGGVGFAIVENMLYEAAGARLWPYIAVVRGVGGVLHPLNAGLVALGWYGVRAGAPGAWRRLGGYYGLAVGIHALWNGGLALLYSDLGIHLLGAESWTINIYGIGQPGIVVVFMALEALALWRLLVVVTDRLRDPSQPPIETALSLHLERPRRLALWAAGLMLILVPTAALYGPLIARYAYRLMPVT